MGQTMVTDINVTYPIAANVTLIQPWWIPLLSASSGLVGAILGASAVLITSYLAQSSEKNKQHIAAQIKSLNERKTIYSNFLYALSEGLTDDKNMADFLLQVDEEIWNSFIELINKKDKDFSEFDHSERLELCMDIIPILRVDLNKIEKSIKNLQYPKKEHWWQFWR